MKSIVQTLNESLHKINEAKRTSKIKILSVEGNKFKPNYKDNFAHIIFGSDYYELDSGDKKEINPEIKNFITNATPILNKIGVNMDSKGTISGVTPANYWKYVYTLGELPWPGSLYYDDIIQFIPNAKWDESKWDYNDWQGDIIEITQCEY